MAAGLWFIALGLAVLSTSHDIGAAAVGMGIFGLGYGLVFPASTALVAEATDVSERGTAFGVFFAVYSAGVIVGSGVSGFASELAGGASMSFVGGAAFAIAVGLALAVFSGSAVRASAGSG
jgi:MFS family permease